MKTNLPLLLLTIACILPTQTTLANSKFHSLTDITATAQTHLTATVDGLYDDYQITLKPLDKRLKLTPCDHPLEAFTPAGSKTHGNTTVGVKCAGPKPWSIFVPAQVKAYTEVFVFNAALPARTPLNETHVRKKRVDVSTVYFGTYQSIEDLQGYETRYPVRANEVVSSNKLQQPKLVKTGESVTIINQYNGIQVRASGTALSGGVKGDRIRIRNHTSQRIIEGYIDSANTVVINYK